MTTNAVLNQTIILRISANYLKVTLLIVRQYCIINETLTVRECLNARMSECSNDVIPPT